MIYRYCTKCKCRLWTDEELLEFPSRRTCVSPSSHRATKDIQSCANFKLGGRRGDRIVKLFDTAEDAKAYEYNTKADYKKGKYFPDHGSILFSDLADRYYNEHCKLHNVIGKSKITFNAIQRLKAHFPNYKAIEITADEIDKLRTKLKDNGLGGATVNRLIGGVLRSIFSFAVSKELILFNPCRYLKRMKEDEPIPRFLDREEIKRLYAAIDSDRLRDYADIIFHTGARPSSIERCSFDDGDVDMTNRIIWFTTYKGNQKKHRYPVPMDSVVHEIVLRRMIATGGKGLVFDVRNIQVLAEDAIAKSGVNEGKSEKQKFTIYGLKHCRASYILMSGGTLYDVQTLFGHTDTKMIQKHYGKLTMDYLRKVQDRANNSISNVRVENGTPE